MEIEMNSGNYASVGAMRTEIVGRVQTEPMNLHRSIETVQKLSNIAHEAADRLESCAARLLGSQPGLASASTGGPETDGAMSMLAAALLHLDAQLTRIASHITRIESL
jgi:hypothetical protein